MSRRPAFHNDHPPQSVHPIIRVVQLSRTAIQMLTALAEAYEDIGSIRTLDEDRGILELWIMPDFKEEFEALIEEVGRQWPIQSLDTCFE